MNMKKYFLIPLVVLIFTQVQAQDDVRIRRVFELEKGKPYFFLLKIDAGEVNLRPNHIENELSVLLRYSEDAFVYDFDFNERRRSLEVHFEKESWVDGDDNDLSAEVEILLPPAVLLKIESEVKAGEVELELGDLSITDFSFKAWAGSISIDFKKPNRKRMESFVVNTKVGETTLRRLGNARFQDALINSGIGELIMDFKGEKIEDARVDIDLDIGETEIFIPEEYGVKLRVNKFLFLSQVSLSHGLRKSGKYYYSENYESAEGVLRLLVSPGIGELHIVYR